jgi:hypothetical protein
VKMTTGNRGLKKALTDSVCRLWYLWMLCGKELPPSVPTQGRSTMKSRKSLSTAAIGAAYLWIAMISVLPGLASADGVFVPTGSMTAKRVLPTATLLPNGQVLVVGGSAAADNFGTVPSLASAELYAPMTGMFSATGSMSIGRVNHTATLLPNGRVLIAGGTDGLRECL